MVSPARLDHGFTKVELLVTLIVLAGIVLVSTARISTPADVRRCNLMSSLSNARQIHMAAMAMAVDGATNDNPGLGWPNDLKSRGKISTLSDYVNLLVRNDYLRASDLKLFAGPDITPYKGALSSGSNGVLVPDFKEKNNAFKVYLVKASDSANTVFLATKNYTYGKPLDNPKATPHGTYGFVVLRKSGDASAMKPNQTVAFDLIGPLPGGTTEESATNCLNPAAKAP